VPELTTELQRMADNAAHHARPSAAADIIAAGDARRRRSRTRQALGGLSAAGVAGAGVALGLALTSSAPGHATGTIQTAAFTLVSHANGTAMLTINPNVLFEPGTLQRDLAQDGIPAKVTAGSFCSSDPAPASVSQAVSVPKIQPGEAATVTINPAAIPAGTELSFGSFQLANGGRTLLTLIDTGSYTCTSTAPNPPAHGTTVFGRNRSPSR
jgi:hypothetical protein